MALKTKKKKKLNRKLALARARHVLARGKHANTASQQLRGQTSTLNPANLKAQTCKVVSDWALQGYTLLPLLFNFPASSSSDCLNPYCDIQQTMGDAHSQNARHRNHLPGVVPSSSRTIWTQKGDIATSNQQHNSSQFKKLGFQLGTPQNKPRLAVTAQSALDQTVFQDQRC